MFHLRTAARQVLGPALALCAGLVVAGTSASGPPAHVLRVPLPAGLTPADVGPGGGFALRRLDAAVAAAVAAARRGDGSRPDVVLLVDATGRPILPDLEAARSGATAPAAERGANQLSFTFVSTDYPWHPSEIDSMSAALADFQPTARSFYGDPAFSNTVNVRQDPSLFGGGYYVVATNEIVISSSDDLETLCHEMIHAFRDDYVALVHSFEEGMTVAAEILVFNLLPGYAHVDENHAQNTDVHYEALSRFTQGSQNGNLFLGYLTSTFLRYRLTGYAWTKVYLETSNFFRDFNAELYLRAQADPEILAQEAELLDVLATVQGAVEGLQVLEWYGLQGVLDTNPPKGALLFERPQAYGVDLFRRLPDGSESTIEGALIQWAVRDVDGALLASGAGTTDGFGAVYFSPSLPPSYTGRARIEVETTLPEGTLREVSLRKVGPQSGVFGVVEWAPSGQLTVTPLDGQGAPVNASVAQGAFSVASLGPLRGRFLAQFTDGVHSASRRFNKDAAAYFLFFPAPAGRVPDGAASPGVPLRVGRDGSRNLSLDWETSCAAGDGDYEVYEGALGDFTSHAPRLCSTAGRTSTILVPPAGSTYYLVVPRNSAREGSYGSRSGGMERSPGVTSCLPQQLGGCP